MGDVKTNRRCLETAGCFTGIHFQARIPQTLSGLDVQQLPSRARHHLVLVFIVFAAEVHKWRKLPPAEKCGALASDLPESKSNLVLIIISNYKGEQ